MIQNLSKRYRGRRVFENSERAEMITKQILDVLKGYYPSVKFLNADIRFEVIEDGRLEHLKFVWVSDDLFELRDQKRF